MSPANQGQPRNRWRARSLFVLSIRWKITLATMAAMTLLLSLLGIGSYSFTANAQQTSLIQAANSQFNVIRMSLEQGNIPEGSHFVSGTPIEVSVGNKTIIADPMISSLGWNHTLGSVMPGPRQSDGDDAGIGVVDQFRITTTKSWHPWANRNFDIAYMDIPSDQVGLDLDAGQTVVRIAAVIHDATSEQLLKFLRLALFIAIPVVVALVGSVAYVAVSFSLRPVDRIRRKLKEVTAANLGQRLFVPRTGDEIQALAEEGNAALERLEIAERSQQQFIANAAHDLRSPLASLYSTLEIARLYPDSQGTEQTLADAEQQVKRLMALAEQLLEIEQLNSLKSTGLHEIDIQRLVTGLVEVHSTPVPVTVHIKDDLPQLLGLGVDQRLFGSALSNLLSNAQRHARSTINLHLAYQGPITASPDSCPRGTMLVAVANDGPPIAEQDRERIFERFTRLDEARSASQGGSGLGLALTAQIMAAAGGDVQVTQESGMTVFRLRFPATETTTQRT